MPMPFREYLLDVIVIYLDPSTVRFVYRYMI